MNQTQAVREQLITHGFIDVHSAIFRGIDGLHPTRVAAIVWNLRHRDKWNIKTIEEPGKLAKYVLLARPDHPDDWEMTPEGIDDASGMGAVDPDDDVPGLHGMPPDEPDPRALEVEMAGRAAEARHARVAASRYECPKCHGDLQSVTPTALAPGFLDGRCMKGHRVTVRA